MLPTRHPVRRRGKKWPAGGNNPGGAEGYDEIMQGDTEGDIDQTENFNIVRETAEEHERLGRAYGEGVIIFAQMKNQPDKLAYFCQICQVQMNSRSNLEMHAEGGKHNQNMVLFESGDVTSTDCYEEQEILTNKEKRVIRSREWKKRQDQEESGQDWEYLEGGQIRDLRELVQGKVKGKPGRGRGGGNPGRGRNGRDYGELTHVEGEDEEERGRGSFTKEDLTVREKLVHIRDMLLQSEELKPFVHKHGDSGSSRRRTSDRNHAEPYPKRRYSPPEPNISSHLHGDEPPNVPHPRDGPPYVPHRRDVPRSRDGPPFIPRPRDEPSFIPRPRDEPSFIPRPRDEPSYVPRPRDEPPYVPRPRDEPPFVPRPRDEPPYVPRHREEGPYVPRPREGPPYVPHPDDERPALRRSFPRPASTSSIRSSSGVPYVDLEPMPPRSIQTDDAAKTFALLKTLEGYKLNDDYDADTAAVALKTLVNSIKFFINSSCVADAGVQVKLKQILDETSGKLEILRSLLREESTQSNAAMTVEDPAPNLSYSRELYPPQQGPPAPSTTFQAPQKPYYTPFL